MTPNELFTATAAIMAVVVAVVVAVVGIPVWINGRLNRQRDEFFTILSKNKTLCSDVDNRVGILEVKQSATEEGLKQVHSEIGSIKDKLNSMQLKNQENHLTLLTAISYKRIDDRKDNHE